MDPFLRWRVKFRESTLKLAAFPSLKIALLSRTSKDAIRKRWWSSNCQFWGYTQYHTSLVGVHLMVELFIKSTRNIGVSCSWSISIDYIAKGALGDLDFLTGKHDTNHNWSQRQRCPGVLFHSVYQVPLWELITQRVSPPVLWYLHEKTSWICSFHCQCGGLLTGKLTMCHVSECLLLRSCFFLIESIQASLFLCLFRSLTDWQRSIGNLVSLLSSNQTNCTLLILSRASWHKCASCVIGTTLPWLSVVFCKTIWT